MSDDGLRKEAGCATELGYALFANPAIETRFKRPGSPLMHLKSYQRSNALSLSQGDPARREGQIALQARQCNRRLESPSGSRRIESHGRPGEKFRRVLNM
jgi:hypothetical protein